MLTNENYLGHSSFLENVENAYVRRRVRTFRDRRRAGRTSMAPTVSSSAASLAHFVHSPSPGDPAVPAPELSEWIEQCLVHFHASFSDPAVSMYPELSYRDTENCVRCIFDTREPGTLWVYRSLHRALRLLRAWAEEDAGKTKGQCSVERFAEGIEWFVNVAVPAVFDALSPAKKTVPPILLEKRAVIALALFNAERFA